MIMKMLKNEKINDLHDRTNKYLITVENKTRKTYNDKRDTQLSFLRNQRHRTLNNKRHNFSCNFVVDVI